MSGVDGGGPGTRQKGWVIGVDVGGTFTDLYALGPAGEQHLHKLPSTPENPSRAVIAGVQALLTRLELAPAQVERLAHGTTVGTNALLQHRGARVALVTTRGFRDLLEIGRQTRPHMYDLYSDQPPPLVSRQLRFELDERVGADALVLRAPGQRDIEQAVRAVADSGVEACAICFLFSFIAPDHEQALAEALARRLPDLHISVSSEVQPEFREFERCSTTVMNAYLQPIMARYIASLQQGLRTVAGSARLGINQSSGGLMSAERARAMPVRTALSGPAAGAVAAGHLARLTGRARIITLDMGGTSADVALISGGRPDIQYQGEVGGYPIRLPMVDVGTVGAGGGSIAWFDRDGLLKVGPNSAGAVPGPACYRRGGEAATVTDANLLLGRLSPTGLLDGQMPMDLQAAARALQPLAGRLGFGLERTACGIVDIAVANMVRAIRRVSVERGHDPRNCALLAFGGAGPLHARAVARSLDISEVIVPAAPGILCAQGLLVSDLTDEFVFSKLVVLDESGKCLLQLGLSNLAEQAQRWFEDESVPVPARQIELTLDARYQGQNFELPVALWTRSLESLDGPVSELQLGSVAELKTGFERVHEQAYGYANADDPIEAVNLRLRARALQETRAPDPVESAHGEAQPVGHRPVWFDSDQSLSTPVFKRSDLAAGHTLLGPCVVEQLDTTTIVFPQDSLRVDSMGQLIITLDGPMVQAGGSKEQ